jgi:tetratricopeptide (TPR) repeat protein
VTAAFDMSYKGLTPSAARCYRLVVGLHPGAEFATPLATAVLGLTGADTVAVLDELVLANLLTQVTDGRYSYHDLVGVHARRHVVEDPQGQDACRRILTWYLAGTRAADQILTGYRRRPAAPSSDLPPDAVVGFGGRDEALDWLVSERPNLVAVVGAMAGTFPELVYLLADAMWPLFLYGRHHPDRMQVDRIAVDCARRLGNRGYEAATIRRQGYAYYDTGRFTDAQRLFGLSLQIAETADGLGHVRAASVAGLGVVALAQADLQAAARHFQRELELITDAGDSRGTGFALLHLGQVSRLGGQADAAVDYLTRASGVFADLADTDRYNGARVRIELGRALADSGKPQHGATQIREALAVMTGLRSPRGRAEALHALGDLACATGAIADADTYLIQAADIYDSLGDAEAAQVRRLAVQLRQDLPE